MSFSLPPIKEPLFISGTILSPVWIRWFSELFTWTVNTQAKIITINEQSSLLNFISKANDQSTFEEGNTLLNFIPKVVDQSSNDPMSSIGVDLVMSMIPKSEDKSTFETVNMQTLYWMGV